MTRHSNEDREPELNQEITRQLEETIFSARNFVVPSPDLRPRTLEQAKEAYKNHMWANRIAVTVLGCMFLWSVTTVTTRFLGQYRGKLSGPFPEEIQQRAASYPRYDSYGTPWHLVEVFQQERSLSQDQANSVRRPSASNGTF